MPDFNAQLLTAIQAQPDGLSLADATEKWPDVPRRSLQRALAKWVTEGEIAPVGKARATRYLNIAPKVLAYALPTQDGLSESSTWRAEEELSSGQWPLSPDSKDIRAYLAQPWSTRQAVGYQSEFLQAYQPNVTFYLPQPVRAQLHRMGRTGPGPQLTP
jgi:hypothetical protein